MSELPFAWGGPVARGRMRACPEDFQVDEELGFEPDGEGQHLLLQLRKREANTDWVAKGIARLAGVPPNAVGYAGLKDRHAVTTQWFSIDLAGRAPPQDWSGLGEGIEVLRAEPHRRKLHKGALRGNRFRLLLREIAGEREPIEARLSAIASGGIPNYFGVQRFGRDGDNLNQVERLFAGELGRLPHHLRGLYLSSARSHLFNQVLARRVEQGSWNRALPGDLLMLDGRRALFPCPEPDAEIERRIGELDIHPTGPLYGKGRTQLAGVAANLEAEVMAGFTSWCEGLERFGLEVDRRPLRVRVAGLAWRWLDEGLEMTFSLPAGAYATGVLMEIGEFTETSEEGV